MEISALHGACACGRNRYIVEVPATSTQLAQVLFDNSSSNRRALASPFTAWLRVPLAWFHSQTLAFFPDETHRSIRRTFSSPFENGTHRQFCGYCGTQLSRWDEGTVRADEDFISLTLGSLFEEDLERLEDLGLLGLEDTQGNDHHAQLSTAPTGLIKPAQGVAHRGAPWFESMVEDSRLGKIKRQRGGGTSRDGAVRVEWEILEWTDGDDDASTPGKRKHGELDAGDDVEMLAG